MSAVCKHGVPMVASVGGPSTYCKPCTDAHMKDPRYYADERHLTRQHMPTECWCGQSWDLRDRPTQRPGLPRVPFALRGKVATEWNGEHYEFRMLTRVERIWLTNTDPGDDTESICTNCGTDLAAEGQVWCADCLKDWRVCALCQSHLATDDTDWCAACLERDAR